METAGNSVSEQTHDAQEAYTRLISHIRSSSISDEAKKQIILEYLRSNLSEKINLSKLKRDTGFSYDKLCRWFRNIKSSVHNQTSFSSSAWGRSLLQKETASFLIKRGGPLHPLAHVMERAA